MNRLLSVLQGQMGKGAREHSRVGKVEKLQKQPGEVVSMKAPQVLLTAIVHHRLLLLWRWETGILSLGIWWNKCRNC